MNKKNIAILILVIVLVAGAYVLYLQRSAILNATHKIASTNKSQQTPTISVQDKKITDNTKPFKIDITYPSFSGADDLNKKIADFVNSQISDFKTNSLENDSAVKKIDPVSYAKYPREYDLTIGYDKGIVDENTISTVLEVYSFTGGAHGATTFISFNYNPKTKTEIKLADLFTGQPDYLKTISDFSIKYLTGQIDPQMLDKSWLNTGAGPVAENFSVFLINKDNITFYIQQYQVAAGAAGEFKVVFPK